MERNLEQKDIWKVIEESHARLSRGVPCFVDENYEVQVAPGTVQLVQDASAEYDPEVPLDSMTYLLANDVILQWGIVCQGSPSRGPEERTRIKRRP